jgi:hypothetical protein
MGVDRLWRTGVDSWQPFSGQVHGAAPRRSKSISVATSFVGWMLLSRPIAAQHFEQDRSLRDWVKSGLIWRISATAGVLQRGRT